MLRALTSEGKEEGKPTVVHFYFTELLLHALPSISSVTFKYFESKIFLEYYHRNIFKF